MRADRRWLYAGAGGGVLWAILLIADAWPLLRGPAEWRWALAPIPPAGAVMATAVTLALFVLGWWGLGATLSARTGRALVALGILSLGVQAAILWSVRANPAAILFERLASDQASGYFTVATSIEHLPTFLREFPDRLPNFAPDPHPRSKPPGIILIYWAAERLLAAWPEAAAWLGHWGRGVRCGDLALVTRSDAALAANGVVALVTPLLSVVAIWPAFALGTRRGGAPAGWLAAGLVALSPGRLLFAPHMDTIYPLLALLALWAVDTGMQRERWGWTAVGGLVTGVATFLSLVNGVIGVLLALFVTWQRRPNRELSAWLAQGSALAAGAALPWLMYWLTSRVTPWAIYAAAAPARHDLARNYLTWLPGNLYDFALFAGLPAFFLALAALFRGRRTALAAAFWLLLAALLLSGAIRGEVGRIWLMLAPFPVLLATVYVTDGKLSRAGRRGQLGLLIGTAVLTAVMGLRLEVTQLEWPPPAGREVRWQLPADVAPDPAPFGPDITLLSASVEETTPLEVSLYWQATRRPAIPYTAFVHVVDASGQIAAQTDVMPRVPATCWQRDEVVADSITVDTAGLASGSYRVDVGLYNAADGHRPGEPVTIARLERP